MTAIERHIATKLVLVLDAGQIDGKKTTKRVTISGLRDGLSAEAILEAVRVLEKLLEHPVDTIQIHRVSGIERADENGEAEEDGETAAEAAGTEGSRGDGQAAPRAFGGFSPGNYTVDNCALSASVPRRRAAHKRSKSKPGFVQLFQRPDCKARNGCRDYRRRVFDWMATLRSQLQ